MPALGFSAGETLVLFLGAERVARRMAGAAMAEALDEIRAAVPLRIARRIGLEDARLEIARLPYADQGAHIEGKDELVPAVLGAHRIARHDVSGQRADRKRGG